MDTTLIIIIAVLAVIINVIGLVYFILNRQARKSISNLKQELNETKIQYRALENSLKESKEKFINITTKTAELELQKCEQEAALEKVIQNIQSKQEELKSLEDIYNKQITDKKETIRQEIDNNKKEQLELMQSELDNYRNQLEEQKAKIQEEYEKEQENFNTILEDFRAKRESIIKINKEEEEIRENDKFYTLQVSNNDIADIEILERVKSSLSRPDILSKLIYKTYYEKPYTDLVGRVVGGNKTTGIYKITNLLNNKAYIGQAVDIAERWRQHIKRAVGAEPMTTNKLYPAMQQTGPYNFSWQVVEVCKKEELTAKEKYWIQYYDTQNYGYNIKG